MRTPASVEAPPGELCCAPLGARRRLTPSDAAEITLRLQALADPARVTIVSILAGREDHELTTRELAPAVSLGEATVSHHLKRLMEAGLVSKRREGARVFYGLNLAAVRAVSAFLDCCERPDQENAHPGP